MKLDSITKDALHPGDILLCKIPELPFSQYLASMIEVIRHYVKEKKFDLEAATPLIHWIICHLDQHHYFHASFWNGSKLVESRIKGGLRANDIETYADDIADVYRYHQDGRWLGDAPLPVEPLLQKAQSLVDKHWAYGFDSAYLLAILCVTRWPRNEWLDQIRDFLVHHSPDACKKLVADLFKSFRGQIEALIERLIVLALEVVRQYRNRQGYVCSQTVAVIFNEASDAEHPLGTYKIRKPAHLATAPSLVLAATAGPREPEDAAGQNLIQELKEQLAQLPAPEGPVLRAAHGTDYVAWQAELRADNLFTPRDLADSPDTELVGRLKL